MITISKYSMNGQSQVVRGVKLNCVAAMQGAQHVLIINASPPAKKLTNRPSRDQRIELCSSVLQSIALSRLQAYQLLDNLIF